MARILVIDDRAVNRQYLATLLGYFGHNVSEAGDGGEALETIRNCKIKLVIADVLMPTMDGYDFLAHLTADRRYRGPPVIFYTAARYEPEARAMAEAHGVRHFLTKPAEPQVILDAVNSALGMQKAPVSPESLTKFNRKVLTAPADPIDPKAVVFVVDDDFEVRHALSEIITAEGLKTEAFATAEAFLESYEPAQPGCLVLDIYMPGMTGINLLEILRSRRIHIPAIILTGHGHAADAVAAMRFGVVDFLEKTVDRRILLARIYRALQEDSISRREFGERDAMRQLMATLTARESDVVKMLVVGKTSKEIAAALRISVRTVSNHRAQMMAKTGAINLGDLVRMTMLAR